MAFGTAKSLLFIEVSSFQGVLIRGVPAVLFIEVSSFQGVLIRGVPAVLFIEVSSFQGVLIRGVPLYIHSPEIGSRVFEEIGVNCVVSGLIMGMYVRYLVTCVLHHHV